MNNVKNIFYSQALFFNIKNERRKTFLSYNELILDNTINI